jgi:hypothetical protein
MKKIRTKRAQLQVSFAWIFAIIVGAFILFLAIYLSTKVVKTGDTGVSAKTGKEISALLNPLEIGFESGVVILLGMPVETRIYNQCDISGNFGRQIIKVSQKSFNKWTETDAEAGFPNKFIFSESVEEGKNFLVFSKPFEFPFKVSDLIYMTSANKKYCFFKAPTDIKKELKDLGQDNILVEDSECPEGSINVCFNGENCDINVDKPQRSVKKRGNTTYYETDSLMYAAIFSDKAIYECQVKRLMKRTEQLAILYDEKMASLSAQGCSDTINLQALASATGAFTNSSTLSSQDLFLTAITAEQVNRQNDAATCTLW